MATASPVSPPAPPAPSSSSYTLDARRCISYLTIELEGEIPETLRPLIGNRIYGYDDCQLICPWNRFSRLTDEPDFSPRAVLHAPELVELLGWNEATFLRVTEGSAIRHIGYVRWSRNIAVALGNAPYQDEIVLALRLWLGELCRCWMCIFIGRWKGSWRVERPPP